MMSMLTMCHANFTPTQSTMTTKTVTKMPITIIAAKNISENAKALLDSHKHINTKQIEQTLEVLTKLPSLHKDKFKQKRTQTAMTDNDKPIARHLLFENEHVTT